ncbi:hypothetical protein FEE95_11795 [Maribacter algarum]|uniref:Uncharacterized protein n=1 Tax=Maribacter algarum (ex Zhang et al. 2020) TaxID=2578118 RepID=A0A5S3PQZ7_9FLAO|nr:hypothetical protein [Maribacter algarum]TMM57167.1 hypothetical protein FEE95_11795 [Maribacter algarum]
MGKKKNKFKKFLQNNEIWFTTVASILLSVMALILATNSNNLYKRQISMDYANYHPEYKIYKSLLSSQENEINDDLEIIIENKNKGIARNLSISLKMFLNISIYKRQYEKDEVIEERELSTKRFFLEDQFRSIYSDENKSRIKSPSFKHGTYVNDSIYFATQEQRVQLFNYMLNQELQKSNAISFFEREIIIELSYLNFLNKKNVEYHRIYLDPLKEESTIALGRNMTAEYIESKQEARKAFYTKEKLNYISFVTINNFKGFLKKINEEKSYFYDEINSLKFQLREMDTVMVQKFKGSTYLDSTKVENLIEKIESESFNELLSEMK